MTSLFRSAAGPWIAGGVFILALSGCNEISSPTSPTFSDAAVTSVLDSISQNVILADYTDLTVKADSLQQAVNDLSQNPSADNLTAAQQAWRNARVPWESCEGFLFGPVETIPVDAPIDSWPLNSTDLDNVLNSGDSLTEQYVAGLNENLKGFHTIEYLLFGDSAAKQASDLTSRQLEYLQGATDALKQRVDTLLHAWSPSGGDYLGAFQNAGQGSAIYGSRSQALEDLIDAIIDICDEVGNSKISGPYNGGQPNDTLEESRFSNNSDADFANNIRSDLNIYLGTYGKGQGNGLKVLVAQKDSVLAQSVENQIDSAITAIQNMTPSFRIALVSSQDKVRAAIAAVQTLKTTLQGPLKAVLLP